MKGWIQHMALGFLVLATPVLVALVVTAVLSIKWRADDCAERGARAVHTESGHIVCLHPDGTVSQP